MGARVQSSTLAAGSLCAAVPPAPGSPCRIRDAQPILEALAALDWVKHLRGDALDLSRTAAESRPERWGDALVFARGLALALAGSICWRPADFVREPLPRPLPCRSAAPGTGGSYRNRRVAPVQWRSPSETESPICRHGTCPVADALGETVRGVDRAETPDSVPLSPADLVEARGRVVQLPATTPVAAANWPKFVTAWGHSRTGHARRRSARDANMCAYPVQVQVSRQGDASAPYA
jgi:hypothetical protein